MPQTAVDLLTSDAAVPVNLPFLCKILVNHNLTPLLPFYLPNRTLPCYETSDIVDHIGLAAA